MKTVLTKFNNIVKEGISLELKNEGFKKQGLHYFKQVNDNLGYAINIQKNKNNTKQDLKFTINVGVFSSKFWLESFDHDNTKKTPALPKEYESIIRERIGDIKYGKDYWYSIEIQKLEWGVMKEVQTDIKNYILPFLYSIDNEAKLIKYLEDNIEVHGNKEKIDFLSILNKPK